MNNINNPTRQPVTNPPPTTNSHLVITHSLRTNQTPNSRQILILQQTPQPTKQIPSVLSLYQASSLPQLNCNNISGKAPEIAALQFKYQIHIEIFRETKLKLKNLTPSLGPIYTITRKNRTREGGGLLASIRKSLLYEELETADDGILESHCVQVNASTPNLRIINFYITPALSAPKI